MVNLDITSNIRQFEKQMLVNAKQVPFAAAKAATNTIYDDVYPYIKNTTFPDAFEGKARAKNMVNGRTFEKIKAKKTKIEAVVQTRGKTDYLQMHHVDGETRVPHKGKWMLTPQINKGPVTKYKRHKDHSPTSLLKKPEFFFGQINGKFGIWERKLKGKKKVKGLVLWYAATPRQDFSDNQGSLKFYEDALKIAERNFGKRFYDAYRYAIRTAR